MTLDADVTALLRIKAILDRYYKDHASPFAPDVPRSDHLEINALLAYRALHDISNIVDGDS